MRSVRFVDDQADFRQIARNGEYVRGIAVEDFAADAVAFEQAAADGGFAGGGKGSERDEFRAVHDVLFSRLGIRFPAPVRGVRTARKPTFNIRNISDKILAEGPFLHRIFS